MSAFYVLEPAAEDLNDPASSVKYSFPLVVIRHRDLMF